MTAERWIRIGIIYPASGIADHEFYQMAPPNITIHVTRIPLEASLPEHLLKLSDYAVEAALLLAQAKVDLIAFCCTAGSFIHGVGFDLEIIRKIEKHTGISATTTSTAVVSALKKLGAVRIAVVTPYIDEINRLEKSFLEGNGFKVLRIEGLGLKDSVSIGMVEPEELYWLVSRVYTPDADVIFISCGGLRTVNLIERFEAEFKRPVISSNQATMWEILRKTGFNRPITGFGRLLREHLP
ncbi:MAG: maleate cis-trans isomerase [Candidatus Hecatellales archaeon]|nr:MAG: maleate cis-trans isomerase [Candidatus Hecatellales archaeon]